MCACNQSSEYVVKDSELADKLRYLADKLRYHHNERNRMIQELESRGFTVYGKKPGGTVAKLAQATIERIEKIEKISL